MKLRRATPPDPGHDGVTVASNDTFHLAWFRVAPDRANVARMTRSLRAWLEATSGPRFAFFVADDTDPPPIHAMQSLAEAAVLMAQHHVRGGVVIHGAGFRNAVIRGSIATISMLTRKGLEIVVAATADEMFEKLPAELQQREAFDEVVAVGSKRA